MCGSGHTWVSQQCVPACQGTPADPSLNTKWAPAGPDTADTPGFSSCTNSLTDAVMSLPDVLRSRSAQLVGSLELGAALGRGSYGTVYKGALWALRVKDWICVMP